MHRDQQINVGCMLREHIQSSQCPICLTEQLHDFWIIQTPNPVDFLWNKTAKSALADVRAGLELFHAAFINEGANLRIYGGLLNNKINYLRILQKS
jgi:hypothetical protein